MGRSPRLGRWGALDAPPAYNAELAEVLRVLATADAELTRCAKIQAKGAEVTDGFRLLVGGDGAVMKVLLSRYPLPPEQTCVSEALTSLRFSAPVSYADVNLKVTLAARTWEVSALEFKPRRPTPVGMAIGTQIGSGGLGGVGRRAEVPVVNVGTPRVGSGELSGQRASIVVQSARSAVDQCYADALVASPRLKGELEVRFSVTAEGTVVDPIATAVASPLPEIEACVLAGFSAVNVGDLAGGAAGTAVVGLQFTPN